MTRWITWLIALSVCGGMLLGTGWTNRSTAWAEEGGCGEDDEGNPNLLTIYHFSGELVHDEVEAEGAGALTIVTDQNSSQTSYVRIEVCVPEVPEIKEEESEGEEGGDSGEGNNTGEDSNTGEGNNTGEGDNTGEGNNTGEGGNTGEGDNTGEGSNTGEGNNTGEGDNTGEGNNTEEGGNTGEGEGEGEPEETHAVSLRIGSGADRIELSETPGGAPIDPEKLNNISSPLTLWLKATSASGGVGDIEICAEFYKKCKDRVKVTAMQADLDISHGGPSLLLAEAKEETPGAFTVVNPDDTSHHAERMQLMIALKPASLVSASPEVLEELVSLGQINLNVLSGGVEFWDRPRGGNLIPPGLPLFERRTVWVEATAPSSRVGDITIELDLMGMKDVVKATAIQFDLDIYHGGRASNPKVEDTRGAFTVVNRNDSDADGILDHTDFDVSNETDLMQLTLTVTPDLTVAPNSFVSVLPTAGLSDTVSLNVSSNIVEFWESSTKGSTCQPKFQLSAPKALWVEATAPSSSLGDIQLEVEFMGVREMVKATAIWPEIDVREKTRPYNRVGRDDPRMTKDDRTARNKLLVWHDAGDDNAISFETVKTDIPNGTTQNNSPIWIQLEKKNSITDNYGNLWEKSWEFLTCEMMAGNEKTFPLLQINSNPAVSLRDILWTLAETKLGGRGTSNIEDHFDADLLVKYGIDYDGSATLNDDELMGQYEIFGITQDDYDEAVDRYNIYMVGVSELDLISLELARELCFRFSQGRWEGPGFLGVSDYRPDQDASCAPGGKSAACSPALKETVDGEGLTHNVGALYFYEPFVTDKVKNADGSGGAYLRQFFDARFDVPVYAWNASSDAAKLIRNNTNHIRKKIFNEFLFPRPSEIKDAYDQLGGSGEKIVSFSSTVLALGRDIALGATGRIGLGNATLHPGTLLLSVKKHTIDNTTYYDVYHEMRLQSFVIEDGFDYNYFKSLPKAKYTLASVSGATIQTGFKRSGALPFAGQVPREKIDISGTFDITPVAPERPEEPGLNDAYWLRMDSSGNWVSVIVVGGGRELPMTWFRDWMRDAQ